VIDDVTVIGDVHGCYKTMLALIDKIPDEHKKRICFAGDLIDRGPMSRQVVDYVIDNGHDCVAGNHEKMMIDWTYSFSDMMWLGNGGYESIDSYKQAADPDTPHMTGPIDKEKFEEHRKWMKTLPVFMEYKDVKTPDGRHLVVSHSVCHNYWKAIHGKDKERIKSAKYQIVWNRNFHALKDAGFFNVIGHTPEETNPKIKTTYANIDTGAFFGCGGWKRFQKGGLGYLTALHVPTMTIYKQECLDDKEDIEYFN